MQTDEMRRVMDQAARESGFADEAERAACEHTVSIRRFQGRSVGLVVAGPGGKHAWYEDYPAGVRRPADVARVRQNAEALAKRLTDRAVGMRRAMRRAA